MGGIVEGLWEGHVRSEGDSLPDFVAVKECLPFLACPDQLAHLFEPRGQETGQHNVSLSLSLLLNMPQHWPSRGGRIRESYHFIRRGLPLELGAAKHLPYQPEHDILL